MLKIDKGISDHQTWEDFSEKGLCESIKNLQDYRLKFSKNAINLRIYLQNKTSPITSPNDIKMCHGILFNEIYPWAGTYRKSGIFCRSRDGAPIDNIQDELELLQEQIEILLKEAPSQRAITRIIAFQHARLTTIQAFGDGNSRLSRAITDHFLTLVTRKARSKAMNRDSYLQCLEMALGAKNLAPLSDLFSQLYNLEREKTPWIPSPFRTTNSTTPLDKITRLNLSYLQNPKILEEVSPNKAHWIMQYPWERILELLGGSQTSTSNECKKLWENQRDVPMTQNEFEAFLNKIEKKSPVTHGLFQKRKTREGWVNIHRLLLPMSREDAKKPRLLDIHPEI